MDRRKAIKQIVIIGFIIFILLEIGLRIFGLEQGQLYKSKWIKKVDKLEIENTYIADSFGIFTVNNNTLNNSIQNGGNEISALYHDHNLTINNAFNQFIKKIESQQQQTEFEKAVLEYNLNPVNQDGFYSIPFKQFPNETRKKVLLLGDSFTWGHSTKNKTNSFANELLAKGYIVYNTGISGTDVAQYEAIAKKYIPKLQPDIVILNFYMGNDIVYYKRELKANHPVYYSTNAGNIMAFQNGTEFYSAHEAYNNVLKQMYITPSNWRQKIVCHSRVLTQVWRIWLHLGLTTNLNNFEQKTPLQKPACNKEIENIISICQNNNAEFKLMVIPDYLYGKTNVKDFPYLFENLDYTMSSITKNNYKMSDGHFNDIGHYEYALFIDFLIKSKN